MDDLGKGSQYRLTAAKAAQEADGRKHRSQKSQARIVNAMLELVAQGNLEPSADEIADIAKVGRRSVFRHFSDMDTLYREMSNSIAATMGSIVLQTFEATDWAEVVALYDRLVEITGSPVARLNRAISFNKGCYLGQETVERATSRGGLKKRMFGIKFNGRAPSAGTALSLGGNTVGRVSSAIQSPRFGAIGLAILHHSAWQPGTELKVGEDGTAVVADLPFK